MAATLTTVALHGVELTVERHAADEYTAETVVIEVELTSGRAATVDVYGPHKAFGSMQHAQINWSAIGSVASADAVRYAAAISYAAMIADTLAPSARSAS